MLGCCCWCWLIRVTRTTSISSSRCLKLYLPPLECFNHFFAFCQWQCNCQEKSLQLTKRRNNSVLLRHHHQQQQQPFTNDRQNEASTSLDWPAPHDAGPGKWFRKSNDFTAGSRCFERVVGKTFLAARVCFCAPVLELSLHLHLFLKVVRSCIA